MSYNQWHKRTIFQMGQSHSSQFFPGMKYASSRLKLSILIDPQKTPNKFQWFQKVTSEKKKKKKKKSPPLSFYTFPLPFSIFHLFPFKFFSFPPPFSLSSFPFFSWWVSKNFLMKTVRRALFPLLPPPPRYATDYNKVWSKSIKIHFPMDLTHFRQLLVKSSVIHLFLFFICDMIKENESDVGNIDFELIG